MTSKNVDALRTLHRGLTGRPTPQDVARPIVDMDLPSLKGSAVAEHLGKLAARAGGSLMSDAFHTAGGLGTALESASARMEDVAPGRVPACAEVDDPAEVGEWITAALDVLGLGDEQCQDPVGSTNKGRYSWRGTGGVRGAKLGHVDIRNRWDSEELGRNLPGVSSRQYLKAVRAVAHLQQRHGVWARGRALDDCVRLGKSRLASTIMFDDFAASPETAAFVAYYVSRLTMRTVFTAWQQGRPMDETAEALLRAARVAPGYRPDVVARVLTRQSILKDLDDTQKGALLADYWNAMLRVGAVLEGAFDHKRDRTRMIARPGDDSSTWNAAARAWDQLRTGWLNITTALSMGSTIKAVCPGKVPSLVAADVAFMHLEGAHIDVAVWAELPLPWRVITGDDTCTADMVRDACEKYGMNSDETGWTSAYHQDGLAETTPAPDLVHGIDVGCPVLALVLRNAGVFSGKQKHVPVKGH